MDRSPEQDESPAVAHPTLRERAERGTAARRAASRRSLGALEHAPDRPDPVAVLQAQATNRVADLLPIRYGRMAASPFAFYRGAAAVMAGDLAGRGRSGLDVQLCGDSHLANFGGFASPDRALVFDINDFDETHPGPFEWDVERLVASFEIATRSRGFDRKVRSDVVTTAARAYRETIRIFAGMTNLDIWYARLDLDTLMATYGAEVSRRALKTMQRNVEKAESKDRLKAKVKLTTMVDGELQFASDPPLLVPVDQLFAPADRDVVEQSIHEALRHYRHTMSGDRRHLLEQYRYVDLARKVVGVGSVGTRSWVALFVGRDDDDPLFLQVKEANASVLEPFTEPSSFGNHGHRVVEGQRLMQAASDIFLGWQRVPGLDDLVHDYYVRQLWDWKASPDLEHMEPDTYRVYAQVCGWVLARAHARSGDPVAIGAYLGKSDTFDQAMAGFADAYAERNEADHAALVAAVAEGRIVAQAGI